MVQSLFIFLLNHLYDVIYLEWMNWFFFIYWSMFVNVSFVCVWFKWWRRFDRSCAFFLLLFRTYWSSGQNGDEIFCMCVCVFALWRSHQPMMDIYDRALIVDPLAIFVHPFLMIDPFDIVFLLCEWIVCDFHNPFSHNRLRCLLIHCHSTYCGWSIV